MDTKTFVSTYSGKKIDFDGANGGQCVDLYRQYVKEVLGFPQSPPLGVDGCAADLWTSYLPEYFDQIKITPEFVPQEGDIMIWNKRAGGGYGHVGVVLEGATKDSFQSFDQNWKKRDVCEVINHTYMNVIGVLRPKVNEKKELKYTEEEMTSVRLERDANWDRFQNLDKEYKDFVLAVVERLNPLKPLPAITDKNYAMTLLDDEIGGRDALQKELKEKSDLWSKQERELEEENRSLEERIKLLKKEIADMEIAHKVEMEKLWEKIHTIETTQQNHQEKRKAQEGLSTFFEKLSSIWKGIL